MARFFGYDIGSAAQHPARSRRFRGALHRERCAAQIAGATAATTALAGTLGYARAATLASRARAEGSALREIVVDEGLLRSRVRRLDRARGLLSTGE